MKKKLKKKLKYVYIETAAIACGCMFLSVPLLGGGIGKGNTCYELTLGGTYLGSVAEPEMVENAFLEARARISRETGALPISNLEYEIQETTKFFGKPVEEEVLSGMIYDTLKAEVESRTQKAYAVKINEFTVNLATYEEVVQLLEAAKSKYDENGEFQISIVADDDRELNVYTADVTRSAMSANDVITVTAAQDGTALAGAEAEEATAEASGDGLKDLYFSEKVEIAEAYVTEDSITPLEEAISMVTKDTAKNQVYEVAPGDTLSVIANSHGLYVREVVALNEGLTEDTVLHVGDEIIITVPEPELSVVSVEEATYEEEYFAETEYIDNDSWYTTESVVRQEETAGYHEVTALITNKNGKEESREIIAETVLLEPVPKVIERGTQTPPTYIKPLSGGRLTSGFKWRWGRQHKGIDWACPTGTAIMASCGGTVVQAGWNGGYGNCITIRHPDGRQTRYGHLSKILVSSGQKVTQGQKIGLSGNTGRSTGPHVHFEIIINGKAVNALDYLN